MTHDPDENSAFFERLDRSRQIAATIGAGASGVICAAGVAGLVYVAIKVGSASAPRFGSQGEWLYLAVASLLVAGWGFGQVVKFTSRRRRSVVAPAQRSRVPKITFGSQGLSMELPPLPMQNSVVPRPSGGLTWSFSSDPMPLKTFKLDEAQLAAAEAAASAGGDWDAVCRQVNPEYATSSDVEQSLYRHALQSVIEERRGTTRR